MSAIDTVWHEVIGQIDGIPIYRLKEDSPKNDKYMGFVGKKGDILLGGGSGESPALRLKMPEAIKWWTHHQPTILKYNLEEIVTTYWSNNDAYNFIKKYIELGYDPEICPIETWLGEHMVSWLIKNFPEYQRYVVDTEDIEFDGSIVQDPKQEWVDFVSDWFKHREEK